MAMQSIHGLSPSYAFTESRPCCVVVVSGCRRAVALNVAGRCYARVQVLFAGEVQMFKKHR